MVTLFTDTCTPLMLTNGEVMCSLSSVIVGHECNVICNDRYTPDRSTVTCQTGDIWSDSPVCQGEETHSNTWYEQETILSCLILNLFGYLIYRNMYSFGVDKR